LNNAQSPLEIAQIGINSSDLAGSLRLFVELGFQNAGGHMIWGQPMAIQGLPPSARGQLWWLIGRQRRVQLEFFHLTNPAQRPLRDDWRCCDLGWIRFGIAAPDLDAAKAVLARWDIPITGEMAQAGEPRRLAFRDPFSGCFVEIMEDSDVIPGGRAPHFHDAGPAVVYATSSVSDLAAARDYYSNVLELDVTDDLAIHGPEHEALWSLDGARSESFVVKGGGFLLEIVQYLDPVGRPKADDYTVADQGILNVAIVSRDLAVVKKAVDRVRNAGWRASEMVTNGEAGGAYIPEPEREVEIGSLAEKDEAIFGYVPSTPFLGQMF